MNVSAAPASGAAPTPVARYTALAIRLGFAALLLTAAIPKIIAPDEFAAAIGRYRLLPAAGSAFIAHTLPWLEAVTALGLLVGRRWLGGAWLLASGLATVFLFAVASAWLRKLDITCGCIGGNSPINGYSVLLRALFLVLAARACFHACASPPTRPAEPTG